jgi:predicted lactoylglutathione lyase
MINMNIKEAIKIIEDGPETSIVYGESLLLINDGQCYSVIDLAEWDQAIVALQNNEYSDVISAYIALSCNTTALLCSISDCYNNKVENLGGRESEMNELCGENWKERFISEKKME